jgi:uncharacterized iron-regulated protein
MKDVYHTQHNGYLEDQNKSARDSYFGSATRADHSQMTYKMIADIVKNQLRENLEMTVKEARSLVK